MKVRKIISLGCLVLLFLTMMKILLPSRSVYVIVDVGYCIRVASGAMSLLLPYTHL